MKLTKNGKKLVKDYISELKAKRKEILDAGIDTADFPLPTEKDIVADINLCGINYDDPDDPCYYNGWGVTDNYDADYPLLLKLGRDMVGLEIVWDFSDKDFCMAQDSTVEDDIFGFAYVRTANDKYIVDIHKEYYNSKNCGYDLEVYYECEDGGHGMWIGSITSIRSIAAKKTPLERFKLRATKLLEEFIAEEEKDLKEVKTS